MPTLNGKVRSDIIDCREILEKNDATAAKELVKDIISAYGVYIEDITYGLDKIYYGRQSQIDYLGNLRKLMKKLELFQANDCTPTSTFKQGINLNNNINNDNNSNSSSNNNSNNSSSNNNTNTNTNNISNTIENLFEETKKEIEDNGYLSPEEIEEILQKIDEIKEIHTSEGNKNSKWTKLRGIVSWTATKGITVAASVLNLATAVLKANQ